MVVTNIMGQLVSAKNQKEAAKKQRRLQAFNLMRQMAAQWQEQAARQEAMKMQQDQFMQKMALQKAQLAHKMDMDTEAFNAEQIEKRQQIMQNEEDRDFKINLAVAQAGGDVSERWKEQLGPVSELAREKEEQNWMAKFAEKGVKPQFKTEWKSAEKSLGTVPGIGSEVSTGELDIPAMASGMAGLVGKGAGAGVHPSIVYRQDRIAAREKAARAYNEERDKLKDETRRKERGQEFINKYFIAPQNDASSGFDPDNFWGNFSDLFLNTLLRAADDAGDTQLGIAVNQEMDRRGL